MIAIKHIMLIPTMLIAVEEEDKHAPRLGSGVLRYRPHADSVPSPNL
jgi:hypothetical protein